MVPADSRFVQSGFGAPWEDAASDSVLARLEAQRADVVEVNVSIVDPRANFDDAAASSKRYFRPHRPASSVIGANAVAFPEQLSDIAATVVLPESIAR